MPISGLLPVNSITGGAPNWSGLTGQAVDKMCEFVLRSVPMWRNVVDKHPADQSMVGTSVKLNILQEFAALATTPLDEIDDPSPTSPPVPLNVVITPAEYGNWAYQTERLRTLSYDPRVAAEIATLIAHNEADTIDALIRAIVDAATNILYVNGGVLKSQNNAGAVNSVLANDYASGKWVSVAVAQLRKRKVVPRDGTYYFGIIHTDVSADLRNENSATSWLPPHQYVDTDQIYAGETGRFQGARMIEMPDRVTTATNSVPTTVYNSYFLGRQALAELAPIEPHSVLDGVIVDPLKRKFPVGWKANIGWAIYRNEAIQIAKSAAQYAAL